MNINKKIYTYFHNLLAVFLVILSIFTVSKIKEPNSLIEILIWIIIIFGTSMLYVSFNDIELSIGGIYAVSLAIIFPYQITVGILLTAYFLKYVREFIKSTKDETISFNLNEAVYLTSDLIISSFCASMLSAYWIKGTIDFNNHLWIIFAITIVEAFICVLMIVFSLVEMKELRCSVKEMYGWIKEHTLECADLYAINIPTSVIIVIMYSYFGFLGVLLASSFILMLYTAFKRFSQVVEIEESSCTDTLSQVKNRRYYTEKLPEVIPAGDSIIFVDVNGLKSVNDIYGHDFGDSYIVKSAEFLSKSVEKQDTIIRFGGDEFVLYIKDGQKERCIEIIEKIENLCKTEPFEVGEGKFVNVSMSIGVATSPKEGCNKDVLAKIADERMYANKHSGSEELVRQDLY